MAHRGKELEELVALIETCLSDQEVEIRSPDRIADRVTGTLREVDISLRYRVGSVPILVIVECRDRRATEDVRWIEQITQKRDDLNASRAVAVSSFGFSQPARDKAAFNGIEIRTLKDVDFAVVESWTCVRTLAVYKRRYEVKHVSVALDGKSAVGDLTPDASLQSRFQNLRMDDPILRHSGSQEQCHFGTAFSQAAKVSEAFEKIAQDGTRTNSRIQMNYPDGDRYIIDFPNGSAEVESIVFTAELWVERTEVPVNRVLEYSSEQQISMQSVEFDLSPLGEDLSLSMHNDEDGQISVVVRRKSSGGADSA